MTHNEMMTNIIVKEMQNYCYEKEYEVEQNDVILDLGCSKGFFYNLHKSKLSKYFGVDEDINSICEFLQNNNNNKVNPILLNASISSESKLEEKESYFYPGENKKGLVQSISFKKIIENIGPVDFLKVDIEGFETEVFNDLDFFKKNVKKFGGEFHIKLPGVIDLLNRLKNDKDISFKLYSVDFVDITEVFWNNISYYSEILINGKINLVNNKFIESYKSTSRREEFTRINLNFVNGATISAKPDNPDKEYEAIFHNTKTNQKIYSCDLKFNHWAKTLKTYYIPYKIELVDKLTKQLEWSHTFNCENKNVFICIDSSALGDTLAWIPYIDKFRELHKCNVICSTFHNDLLKNTYTKLKFVSPGAEVPNVYAQYMLGVYFNDISNRHPVDPRLVPMAKIGSDILGLEYEELLPNLIIDNPKRLINDEYVCIGTESTAQCKYWNNPTGWQETIGYLISKGITVVSLKKTGTSNLKGVIEISDKPLSEIINYLYYCKAFIGLGSGLSWLAKSLNKDVVLISGFSKSWCEFSTPYRIINESVCNGCFNDKNEIFDRGNWNWCPKNKNFECTKTITSKMVIEKLDLLFNK